MTYYQITHFERPDDSYPDYDRYFAEEEDLWEDDQDEDDLYFGYDDFDEEFAVFDELHIMNVVDEYCGAKADDVVDDYIRLGPVKARLA